MGNKLEKFDADDFVNSKYYKGLMDAAQKQIYDTVAFGEAKELDFYLTFENWMEHEQITQEQADLYPAAKKARDMKKTKLYKAMK